MHSILLYDPVEQTRNSVKDALSERFRVVCSNSEEDFQSEIDAFQYDLVLFDIDAGGEQALTLLNSIHGKNPHLPFIITSKSEKAELIVGAMKAGACDFLVHPISRVRIAFAVDKVLELRDQRNEINYLRRRQDVVYKFDDVIAESRSMKKILVSLKRFAATDSTILITGDTGTGKSFLSGTIHFNSARHKKPFVKINCANIPLDLLESELFGHEKGAFTGADKQRIGRFEQASGGTIFLDEIGEMTPGLQTKLLRVLEDKRFERVGGNRTIHSDVRIIAATNRNLVEQVEKGLFREDLYYRINVLPVRLPSLRERPECLLPLAHLLLKKCSTAMRRDIRGFSSAVENRIREYNWPGNIRQLANAIERAVILEDDRIIHAASLSLPEMTKTHEKAGLRRQATQSKQEQSRQEDAGEGVSLAVQERALILAALEESLWVQKEAAEKLGISPRALNYRIRKLGITHPHWRRNS